MTKKKKNKTFSIILMFILLIIGIGLINEGVKSQPLSWVGIIVGVFYSIFAIINLIKEFNG